MRDINTMMTQSANDQDYAYASIAEVGEALRQRYVSPVELVELCLGRIERLNPSLNAFITVVGNQARQEAEIAQQEIVAGNWKGPLHGVPVAFKDFFDTAGIKTTAAFAPFKNRVPDKDAEAVTKLKEAGAIVIGKTNMHELGMGTTSLDGLFGSVHNPWNHDYVAGGSSGGSAAAVASGLCYATVDTDAIGSCRLPASCCGVIGFKATHDLISGKGILEGEEADETVVRLSHTTFTCRSVKDAAILLNVLAEAEATPNQAVTDYRSALNMTQEQRIGIVQNFKATDEVRRVFLEATETLGSLGYSVDEVEVPFESASFDITNMDRDRASISQELFKDVNVLLLPTLTEAVPSIEEARANGPQAVASDNTFFCNYYGLPVVTVPCGFSENGLPLGLQIVGPAWGEADVLEVANSFQKVTRWHLQHPGVPS